MFLVLVTVSGLFIRSPCVALAVAVLNSYPVSFIFKLLIALTISSNFSSFSLVNIVFEFSICELDVWLNASSVTFLSSANDSYSSSIMTFSIDSRIFMLGNGVLLLSLKV